MEFSVPTSFAQDNISFVLPGKGFSDGTRSKELTNAGDTRLRFNPWVGQISLGGHGNLPRNSCRENSMDRGALWVIVYGLAKSRTQLSD